MQDLVPKDVVGAPNIVDEQPARQRRIRIGLYVCVFLLCLWIASFFMLIGWAFETPEGFVAGGVGRGCGFFIWRSEDRFVVQGQEQKVGFAHDAYLLHRSLFPVSLIRTHKWRDLGLVFPEFDREFSPYPHDNEAGSHRLWITIPLWCLLIISVIPTVLMLRRHRSIARQGCCQRCGYDLQGNESGRCPECGTPIASTQKK